MEKAKENKNRFIVSGLYRFLSWFVLIYGITGTLFYLFFLLFPLSNNLQNSALGYGPMNFTALELLKFILLLLYGGIVYSGFMLLKKRKEGMVAYFALFFFYYVITYTYSGAFDVYLFVIQLIYGFVLLGLFSRFR